MRQVDLPAFRPHLGRRQKLAAIWKILFLLSTLVGIVALAALLLTIINDAFGLVALQNDVDPASLAREGRPLERLEPEELGEILTAHLSGGLIRRLESEKPLAERSREELYELVIERVARLRVIASWPLAASLLQRGQILEWRAQNHPEAALRFRSWVSWRFLLAAQASVPERAGVRTAMLGTLWTILITVLVAFPLGVGAAIYLEEYARESCFNATHPDQHQQPGRGALDHLRHAGPGHLRAPAGAPDQRRRLRRGRLHHRQRAHHPLGRPDPGPAGAAAGDHQRPGGHPRRAPRLRHASYGAGRHQVADDLAPRAARMPCPAS